MRALLPLALLSLPSVTLLGCDVNADSGPAVTLPANFNPMVSLAPLAETVSPAVVNVYVTQTRKTNVPPQMQYFFGVPGERTVNGQGSGFVISADGYIVTNNHVAEDASEIKVKFANDQEYKAKVIGTDPTSDVALLKIEAKDALPYLKLGDSDGLKVGDWVVAVGNPLGLGHTVTAGIVSGKGRFIPDLPLDDFIQTDASINPGNSGGPLIAMNGMVVGMNTAIIQGANTVGFAIPANHMEAIVTQLRDHGKVAHGFMGISMSPLDDAAYKQLGVASGVLVQSVQTDGPAEDAGLRPGDVLTQIGAREITSQQDVLRAVAGQPPGTKVDGTVRRADKDVTVTVKLDARPEEAVN